MDRELEVLYEDNHIIVVNKPQNISSQGDSSEDQSMLDIVKNHIKVNENKPGNVYVGLVHRLDRPTGGVMVFAKSSKAASRLTEQFKSDDVHKTYLAIVVGTPKEKSKHLVHFLKKNERDNKVDVVPQFTEGAKRAELDYEVLETKNGFSLVKVNLITGRSHQVRVQMKTIGTPIYGDQKYGGEKMPKALLNLFAVQLVFDHPTTKEKMRFIVYPPEGTSKWNQFDLDKYLAVNRVE